MSSSTQSFNDNRFESLSKKFSSLINNSSKREKSKEGHIENKINNQIETKLITNYNYLSNSQLKSNIESINISKSNHFNSPRSNIDRNENMSKLSNNNTYIDSIIKQQVIADELEKDLYDLINKEESKLNLLSNEVVSLIQSMKEEEDIVFFKKKIILLVNTEFNAMIDCYLQEIDQKEAEYLRLFDELDSELNGIINNNNNDNFNIDYIIQQYVNQINLIKTEIEKEFSSQVVINQGLLIEYENEVNMFINSLYNECRGIDESDNERKVMNDVELLLNDIKNKIDQHKVFISQYEESLLSKIEAMCSDLICSFRSIE